MIFAREWLRDCWDEVMELAALHWQETEQYQRHALNPDKERYIAYNESGYHRQYTARVDGRLMGHAGMYINRSMHTQVMMAHEDTWYLRAEARKGRNAIRFYQFIEADMVGLGVEEIHMSAKLANKSGRIMEYLGYEFVAKGYLKHVRT